MKIQKLNASNIDAILRIEEACFSTPWSKEMFLSELRSPFFTCLAVNDGGNFVAFLCFWKIIDEYHIGNIAVLTEYRNRGIAKALLKNLINLAQKKFMAGITLEVRKSNTAAINLYTSFGFKTEGIRPRYYENAEDALIMWLRF